jgi:hypothetical protein
MVEGGCSESLSLLVGCFSASGRLEIPFRAGAAAGLKIEAAKMAAELTCVK